MGATGTQITSCLPEGAQGPCQPQPPVDCNKEALRAAGPLLTSKSAVVTVATAVITTLLPGGTVLKTLRNVGVAQVVNLIYTSAIYDANLNGCMMEQDPTWIPPSHF